jgi:hypothetical protein
MPSIVEKYYPLFMSTVIAVLGSVAFSYLPSIRVRYDILSASISISSILVGFLITTQSLLFAIDSSSVIRGLKESGVYKKLSLYLMNAINASFFSAILSLAALFFDLKDTTARQPVELYFSGCWFFITSLAISRCYRVIYLLNKIIRDYK